MTEQATAKAYDPRDYPPLAASVDVVVLTIGGGHLHALLVEREKDPFAGWWALPGTFIRPDEDADESARRGVAAKTNVALSHVEQLRTYTEPNRDPRMRVLSIAYLSFAPIADSPTPGFHTVDTEWQPVFERASLMAFDHGSILNDGITRAQDKIEYSTLATSFLPEEFTLGELQGVYEAVWNQHLDRANFYKKVHASKGFVVPTGRQRGRAALYRAGDARMLYPPIRRRAV